MLHILKFLFRPLKTEYLMILLGMKTVVMILTVCWLLVAANAIAVATQQQQQEQQQQPQTFNYKQQLQYQMQQHDKFQYQQHIKQQQQYYQQQHQASPISVNLEQQQQQQYLDIKPAQMLQTAASLVVDDGRRPEAFALEQSEFSNANAQRRRPGMRKRKRRPQLSNAEGPEKPTASDSSLYWRGQVEDDRDVLNTPFNTPSPKQKVTEEAFRPSLQTSFKRRKQTGIREPLAALEKEQKLYEMRNKPDTGTLDAGKVNSNSANLKNILKNSGGLSLSEILQQKNLSLDDLLKGKQNALQALQTTATAPQEKINHVKYPSFKANFKTNPASVKAAEEAGDESFSSKERSKLSALQKLKLFGSSSRPIGSQVGLADHLTTRKREGSLYSTSSITTTTTSTTKPSTTKIPLYKKILHQRPRLKPTFLLKNTMVMASAEPERVVTSWDSKELERNEDEEDDDGKAKPNNETEEEEIEVEEDTELTEDEEEPKEDVQELSTHLTETSSWKMDTTMTPSTTTYSTSSSTMYPPKPTTEKSITNSDKATSTRRMFISTRGSGRTTYRYTTSTSTPAATSTTTSTTTTTTPPPVTTPTSTTTSTTTASSSTMNLTPKANLNLNTEDLRERIQETLLKNLIGKEDSYKKSQSMEANENDHDDDDDDDLENFFEETAKPKATKYIETSTITTRMKQYTPSFIHTSSTSSTSSPPATFSTPTENANVIPDFDNVDDRTDLLELIEDRRSGNRLFKVLEQRNMTLEELIEHRKRGSSQLHLATIVESPSRFYPDKKVVLQDNMDIVTAFENFPHFNLLNLKSVKPDDIKTDSQGSSYFTSIIDIEPTDEVYKNRKAGQALSAAELDKASLLDDRSEKSLDFFPSWKTLALASLATSKNNKDAAANKLNTDDTDPYFLQSPKMLLENNSENNDNDNDGDDDEDVYDIKENELNLISRNDHHNDDGDDDDNENDYQAQNPIQAAVRLPDRTVEAIENEVARAHDLVDLELSGHGFQRSPQAAAAMAHSHRRGSFYTNMPPGIKSAIVASATIVLTALVTFMVIFAVCKWKQRRHRMTNIMKSYNAMKSKLPTIAATSTRALNANSISSTNPNSRRSSFREMQDLLGGSGLSVAATITTSSTGVPNTPVHTTKTTSSKPVNAKQTATTVLAEQCSKNMRNSLHHHNSNNNSSCSNSSNSCGLRPLQRQSSLLFQRSFNQNSNNNNYNSSHNENPTNLSILSGCNLLDLKRNNKMNGSTTSLSFSLTSGHNISNSHINTMDANSPEVQEYLFDTLRNSF